MDITQIDPEGTAGGDASNVRTLSERRRFKRYATDIPVRFVLVSAPEGNIIEEGSARICNIRLPDWISGEAGLLEIEVSDIELPTRSLPLKPFQVTLFIEYERLERIHMLCSVRWFNSNGSISLGLHIEQMPEKHRYRLNEFVKEMATRNIS